MIKKNIKIFINHCEKFFPKFKSKKKGIVLVEFNGWPHFHIISSYVSNVLAGIFDSNIYSYHGHKILINVFNESIIFKLKWLLSNFFVLNTFAIYKSFNVKKFINPIFNSKIKKRAELLFNYQYPKLKFNKDIEKISIDKIWVGDLIYDSYLKAFKKKTIDINSENFKRFLIEFFKLFYYWKDYFSKNTIKAVVVSHGVYSLALPLRIAIKNNIPGYIADWEKILFLQKKNKIFEKKISGVDLHYKNFKEEYRKIPKKIKIFQENKIKKKIFLRLQGKGKDLYYLNSEDKFKKKNKDKIRSVSGSKIKVIIYCHTFYDSPHVFGLNLFPDYKCWLDFLEKIISQTDYDWYIKAHPNSDRETLDYIKVIKSRNKKINVVPASYTGFDVSKLGINYALTIYGTVGSELPLYNILVINASLNNPHINYNFNLHPKSINEYKKILLNLNRIKSKINKKEIYEHYYMKHIYYHDRWIFDKFNKMKQQLNIGKGLYSSDIYRYWIDSFNLNRHNFIIKKLKKFFLEKKYRLVD